MGTNVFGNDFNIYYQYYDDPEEDGFGHLKQVIDNNTAIKYEYTYDAYGRVLSQTETIDNNHIYTNDFEYDIFGRLKTQTYPTGYKTTNYYKETGTLGKIEESSTNNVLWEVNDINRFGRITDLSMGNGLTTNYQYDNE